MMRLPFLLLHVTAGVLAMIAGALAISFRKGSLAHRRWGNLFVASMLTVSVVGAYLGLMKSEADNFLGGIFAFYLVATAWATARGEGKGRKFEWGAPLIAVTFATFNLIWGGVIARGQMAVKDQSPAGSYFFFGTLALLCAAGDVRRLVWGPFSQRQRLVRHLWRMCFGWFIATISFFVGQQRIFPSWLRHSRIQVVFAFLPLFFLIFWFARVRFSSAYANGWESQRAEPSVTAP